MHVAELSRADRVRRLKSSFRKQDRVRQHPQIADAWLISSETHDGLWHFSNDHFCDCVGFTQNGMCRHAVRASYEQWCVAHERRLPDLERVS